MTADDLGEDARHIDVIVDGVAVRLWARRFSATDPAASHRFVLLHGNPSRIEHFDPILDFLRCHGEVALYDAPGFGNSPTRLGPLSLDFLADVAAAFMQCLGWNDAHLIGHSHGGAVAQTVAARHPHCVRSLVLLCTMGVPAHASIRIAMLPGVEQLVHGLAKRAGRFPYDALARVVLRLAMHTSFHPDVAPVGFPEAELALNLTTPEIPRSSVRVNDGDPTRQLRAQAARISAPVLAIHGLGDRLVPIEYGRRVFDLLAAGHPRNRFEAVDGGHNLHISRPATVHALLQSWLSSTAS